MAKQTNARVRETRIRISVCINEFNVQTFQNSSVKPGSIEQLNDIFTELRPEKPCPWGFRLGWTQTFMPQKIARELNLIEKIIIVASEKRKFLYGLKAYSQTTRLF